MVAWDWGLETGLTAEGHKGTFKMMEVFYVMNVLAVHDVNIGQNSLNCALNMDELQTDYKQMMHKLCPTLCSPMTIQSMEFSRPEYWSG